jgi:hypothetical protein
MFFQYFCSISPNDLFIAKQLSTAFSEIKGRASRANGIQTISKNTINDLRGELSMEKFPSGGVSGVVKE